MATEENRALVRRWYAESLATEDMDGKIDEFYAPEIVGHSPPMEIEGIEAFKAAAKGFKAALSDVENTLEDVIAERDKVVVRRMLRATHSGELMGIAATGKRVGFSSTAIFRISQGKFVEVWEHWDALGFFQQLGVVPPLGEGGKQGD